MTSFSQQDIFCRAELLLGTEAMERLYTQHVIVFGVGGVGSWCAEALVRSGIRQLTIVDSDCVCTSNINRQLMASTETVGLPKVEVLRQRLLAINPQAEISALQQVFCEETAHAFALDDYDFVIDAIDSLKDKALLILKATQCRRAKLFSSMGAALKLDPTRIRVGEFWKVKGDPLARALRKKFKSQGLFPAHKFLCVFSDELLCNQGAQPAADGQGMFRKAQTNGSLVHITAIFGMILASLVVRTVVDEVSKTV
jgi:tRNA A37 threonylcarbamoyladenosine dehydratase